MTKKNTIILRFFALMLILGIIFTSMELPSVTAATNATVKCIAVAAGESHSAALMEDGTLLTWGGNFSGQLGNGEKSIIKLPTQLDTINDVKAIAAGNEYTLAIKNDGTVWSWGINLNGQLGNGSTTTSRIPVQVTGLKGVVAVSAGDTHAMAIKSDGTLWAWGRNYYGQLGNGTSLGVETTPIKINGIKDVKAVATGYRHTIALKNDGTVWAWGDNDSYQLGLSGVNKINIPTQIAGLSDIVAISAGAYHTVAVKSDGSVYTWGFNANGQLGNGTNKDVKTPTKVASISNVKSVAAGKSHTVFLKADGTVWTSGYNRYGELGTGTKNESTSPVKVESISDITYISAMGYNCLALAKSGTLLAWGSNSDGQIGNESTNDTLLPQEILTNDPVTVTLSAKTVNGSIVLDWDANTSAGIKGYNVYRSKSKGQYSDPRTDFPITASSFNDSNIDKDITYYYTVKAILNNGNLSAPSNEVSAVVKAEEASTVSNETITIILQLDNPMMKVNGASKEVDPGKGTAPLEIDGRTMIPVRAVIEALGGTIGWNEAESKITISLYGKNLEMWLDNKIIKIDGVEKEIDVAPQVKNDRTMVPVRFATQNLGCTLDWNEIEKKVTIRYSKSKPSSNDNIVKEPKPVNEENKPPVDKGEIQSDQYIYNGQTLFRAPNTLDWAYMSPNEKYVAYRADREIGYYDIENNLLQKIYTMTEDEYWGKWVYSYGYINPYKYDFVKWSVDSTYFVVDKYNGTIFKGGSGYFKMSLSDKTKTEYTE